MRPLTRIAAIVAGVAVLLGGCSDAGEEPTASGPSLIGRFLRPATDLGVAVQLIALVTVVGLAAWRVWHRPEWRLVVLGAGLLLLGGMGLRAAH